MPWLLLTIFVFLLALTGGRASAFSRTGIATGSADPAASVTVNSTAAPRAGPWWGQSESTTSGSTAAWLNFSIDATLGGNTDHTDTALLAPPSIVTPAYDADGNLTDDGLRTFTWDAESRLLSVTTKDTLLPAGAPLYRATYQYDDGGRRIAQTVEARTVSGGVYVLVSRRCFLYDGWSCIAEYDYIPAGAGATRTLYRTQVWGLSLAPGGAGGLLFIARHTGAQAGTHCATHDGNGNVTALIDLNTGTESARYDYDPYGNLLQATGPFAAENPYRFSTQYTDEITGLLYYGYRHYDPVQGRWLSRDPIGEAGGLNLYGMVGNDPVNGIDVLGLANAILLLTPTNQLARSLIPGSDGRLYMFDPSSSVLAPVNWNGPLLLNEQAVINPYEDIGPLDALALSVAHAEIQIGNSLGRGVRGTKDAISWLAGTLYAGIVDRERCCKRVETVQKAFQNASEFWAEVGKNPAFRRAVGEELAGYVEDPVTRDRLLADLAVLVMTGRLVPEVVPTRVKCPSKPGDVLPPVADNTGVLVGSSSSVHTFRLSGAGTHLVKTTRVGGQKVRLNSGHGYSRAHRSGDLRNTGLSMDDIDNAIVHDVIQYQRNGGAVPSVTGPGVRHFDRVININGTAVGYRLNQLLDGTLNVSTYWPN